jgi:hypothetical protein
MARATRFLRTLLLVDLVATVGSALLLLVGAGALDGVLGLSSTMLRGAGVALVPFAALQAWLVTRDEPPAAGVTALIAGNALWAVGSLGLLFGLPLATTAIGTGFVVAQAAAVGALAELQTVGLRRVRAAA